MRRGALPWTTPCPRRAAEGAGRPPRGATQTRGSSLGCFVKRETKDASARPQVRSRGRGGPRGGPGGAGVSLRCCVPAPGGRAAPFEQQRRPRRAFPGTGPPRLREAQPLPKTLGLPTRARGDQESGMGQETQRSAESDPGPWRGPRETPLLGCFIFG